MTERTNGVLNMNLYDLTVEAMSKVSEFRSPDLDSWIHAIDPVLEAAGELLIGNDKVEAISMSDDVLSISTSYSVMCCDQSNSMSLPISVLKSSEPLKQATRIRLENEHSETKARLERLNVETGRVSEKLSLLERQLASMTSSGTDLRRVDENIGQ